MQAACVCGRIVTDTESRAHTWRHTPSSRWCCVGDGVAGFQAVVDFAFKGGNTGFPVRAPPILVKGGFSLCFTNVIMSYLNDQFGWGPDNPGRQWQRLCHSDAVSRGAHSLGRGPHGNIIPRDNKLHSS